MSNSRDLDKTEALRAELVQAIVEDLGATESIALPFANVIVDYLQREYPGERLYIPKPGRQYDVSQMEVELRNGADASRVAGRHGITVRHLRRLFPGGLPKGGAEAA
ncbi:hypothetical protein [Marilutibacter spongiae]|uniref:Mor transcription activator domain-containing protein n=1 Tax=Marilutibacter spongiae TaxID=2025720 RepID=A0A7W3TP41_9GAMM|nr:hypothetical protein [Lysobacter spongiae]MBB1061895.1 hypothetical protein [Lysobacter spongiae]